MEENKKLIFDYLKVGDQEHDAILKGEIENASETAIQLAVYAVNDKEKPGVVFMILGV